MSRLEPKPDIQLTTQKATKAVVFTERLIQCADMDDQKLSRVITTAIQRLESEDELVVTCPSIEVLADRISEAVLGVVPKTGLTQLELFGVRSLILHAVADPKFFDWEMPTLTGFSAEEFKKIAQKLPRD